MSELCRAADCRASVLCVEGGEAISRLAKVLRDQNWKRETDLRPSCHALGSCNRLNTPSVWKLQHEHSGMRYQNAMTKHDDEVSLYVLAALLNGISSKPWKLKLATWLASVTHV